MAGVGPDSVLRFRYRATRPSEFVVFLVTLRPTAEFAGNFELKFQADAGDSVADGWREVIVPLSQFPPLHPSISTTPVGNDITHLSIRSYRQEAKMEFSQISIEPR